MSKADISLGFAPSALAATTPQWVVAADVTNGVRAAAGAAYPGMCHTVIKWEPLDSSSSAWTSVDLSADTALGEANGGWKNTNRIGIYAKPGPLIGNTMTEYLAQTSNYQVLAVGASVGTGTAESVGFLQTMTFDGVTFNFRTEPQPPTSTSVPTTESTTGTVTSESTTTDSPTSSSSSSVGSSEPVTASTNSRTDVPATTTSVKGTSNSTTTTSVKSTSRHPSSESTTITTATGNTANDTTSTTSAALAATGTNSSTGPMTALGALLTAAGAAITLTARRHRSQRSH